MKFADLESPNDPAVTSEGMSSLEEWYRTVREQEIEGLEIGDLCKAVRQQLFPAHVLPVATSRLQLDPLSGEDYPGQLLSALAEMDPETLQSGIGLTRTLLSVLNRVIESDDTEPDTLSVAMKLKSKLK